MFKLSVCWVPGELRPLLGRQKVYVSWMYLWKLRLVNSSSLCSFLRDGFFRKKASTIFFYNSTEMCQNLLWSFQAYVLKVQFGNLPWKKIDRHTTIAFSIGVITCCFPPSHIRQAKKRGLKRNPHHHYWGIITQSSFYSGQGSWPFLCHFFQRLQGKVCCYNIQEP